MLPSRQSLIFNICEQALALILEEGRRVGEGLDPANKAEPDLKSVNGRWL